MEKVTAVLPAYNEGKTVAQIVQVLCQVPEICEIIVISDGSTDNTVTEARTAGARVIELTDNRGKGGAIAAGMGEAQYEVVLFLDADLIGLTPRHVLDLVGPVLYREVDMTVGVFNYGHINTDLAQRIAPSLSGQRVLRWSAFSGLQLNNVGYGLEIAMTQWASKSGMKVKQVPLLNMSHTIKEKKCGYLYGAIARCKMYLEIALTLVHRRRFTGQPEAGRVYCKKAYAGIRR